MEPKKQDVVYYDWFEVIEYPFRCKHGRRPCPKCGTSRDDAAHPTRGGKGLVAQLREGRR